MDTSSLWIIAKTEKASFNNSTSGNPRNAKFIRKNVRGYAKQNVSECVSHEQLIQLPFILLYHLSVLKWTVFSMRFRLTAHRWIYSAIWSRMLLSWKRKFVFTLYEFSKKDFVKIINDSKIGTWNTFL